MNDKNKAIFFDDDSEYNATVTVTDEDNNQIETEIIAAVEIEELGREFVALLPVDADDQQENEALILEYSEDEEGEPVFTPLEDEELFDVVSEAFDQFFAGLADNLMEEDDLEEEEDSEDYLSDIGDILPGVSIKKD